jgi:hypothetical protein
MSLDLPTYVPSGVREGVSAVDKPFLRSEGRRQGSRQALPQGSCVELVRMRGSTMGVTAIHAGAPDPLWTIDNSQRCRQGDPHDRGRASGQPTSPPSGLQGGRPSSRQALLQEGRVASELCTPGRMLRGDARRGTSRSRCIDHDGKTARSGRTSPGERRQGGDPHAAGRHSTDGLLGPYLRTLDTAHEARAPATEELASVDPRTARTRPLHESTVRVLFFDPDRASRHCLIA